MQLGSPRWRSVAPDSMLLRDRASLSAPTSPLLDRGRQRPRARARRRSIASSSGCIRSPSSASALRLRALAAKQVAAELAFEQLDGARQRRPKNYTYGMIDARMGRIAHIRVQERICGASMTARQNRSRTSGSARTFDDVAPARDVVGAEVDERAHARGVAQVRMGEQPKLAFELRQGRAELRSPGTAVPT